MLATLRHHWPEYLIEAAGLGVFMISAGAFGLVLEHPGSPVHAAIANPLMRRALMGLAMGLTAIALIYSPPGQRSGAHFNPATTLTFWRLGKVAGWDALFYMLAQFAGGAAGVAVMVFAAGRAFTEPPVSAVATLPGPTGIAVAFIAEIAMTFVLMSVVLHVSNAPRWARFTGLCAGTLVALYITFEAPISGMSLNPARTLASAWPLHFMQPLAIYFLAPPLGMLLAAETRRLFLRERATACAKLHHTPHHRCIFLGCAGKG